MLAALFLLPFNVFSVSLRKYNISGSEPLREQNTSVTPKPHSPIRRGAPTVLPGAELPDSIQIGQEPVSQGAEVVEDRINVVGDRAIFTPVDTVSIATDSISALNLGSGIDEWVSREYDFNPDPTRAVWMAALFPGLGQLYNRRYWKLPLVIGGYLGLGYATSWNNGMLSDYTKAYADIMDNDPNTKSYMDFFPPTVTEESLDKTWLTNVLQSRKNYFRRNRDLCIIGMVAVYLVAMVDAYVDASLAHFDISPDLSMDVYPSLIQDGRNRLPSLGLQWAIVF